MKGMRALGRPGGAQRPHAHRQAGAALLTAMLTVTLVATLAAAALWQQWRSVEVEAAERARVQSAWVLTGALDWARLILREDARSGGADHLAEPWAVALQEARLSTFLAVDQQATDTEREAFLSGQISDLQGRLNVTNLIDGGQVSESALASFARLFDLLGLPRQELATLAARLREASPAADAAATNAPQLLQPQRIGQLAWLGLAPSTLARLGPYITLLPVATPVNLNTASAEVIHASAPGIDLSSAQKLVATRERAHFRSLAEASQHIGGNALSDSQHTVASRFFEARAQLRLDQSVVDERSVLQRDGMEVRVLWRDRGAVVASPARDAGRS
jgi:general secretion pathway protein K